MVLPKSVTPTRIASNMKGAITAARKLDRSDMEKLDGVAASGKQKRSTIVFIPSAFHLRIVHRFIMPPWGKRFSVTYFKPYIAITSLDLYRRRFRV